MSGGKPQKTFYWRGFVSPTGSCRPKQHNAAYRASHPGGGGKWKATPSMLVSKAARAGATTRPVAPVLGEGALDAHPPITGLLQEKLTNGYHNFFDFLITIGQFRFCLRIFLLCSLKQ